MVVAVGAELSWGSALPVCSTLGSKGSTWRFLLQGVRRKKSDLKRLRKQKDVSAVEAEQTAEERLKAELFGTDELGGQIGLI